MKIRAGAKKTAALVLLSLLLVFGAVFGIRFTLPDIGSASALSGAGTAANPFLINSAEDLIEVRTNFTGNNNPGKYFKMTRDIDLSGRGDSQGWIPIGTGDTAATAFRGHFDGNGFAITFMNITRPNTNYQGLFGSIINGSVSNLGISGGMILGGDRTGGIAGYINASTITNCYNKAYVGNQFLQQIITIRLNGNGATGGSMNNISVELGKRVVIPLNTYTRTNYTFKGWSRTPGGDAEIANGGAFTPTNDKEPIVTLYAVWKYSPPPPPPPPPPSYDPGGIVGVAANGSKISRCYNVGTINGEIAGGIVGTLEGASSTSSLTGKPSFVEDCYNMGTVSGIVGPDFTPEHRAVGGVIGRLQEGEVTNIYNMGYVSVLENSTKNIGALIGLVVDGRATLKGSLVYSATSASFSVSVKGVNGISSDPSKKLTDTQMYQRSGFSGFNFNTTWFINDGYHPPLLFGKDGNPMPGQSFDGVEYSNSYSVAFNGNAATGLGGSMSSVAFKLGAVNAKTLPANGFTRLGYTFAGWALSPTGSLFKTNSAALVLEPDLLAKGSTTLTLYALWSPNTNSIIFDKNAEDAVGSLGNQNICTDATQNLTIATGVLTRPGYTFDGWATNRDGTGTRYYDGAPYKMGPNASYTLYAQWTAKTNVVKFDGNDADVGQFMPNQEIPVDVTMKLNKNTLKRNGYRFAGWSYQKLPVNSYNWDLPDEAQVQMPVDGIQLYAVWFSNANRIVFHSNDSSNGSYEIERGTGSSGVLPVCEFKRDGYNFLGWATSPNGAATVFGDTQYVMGSNPEYHLYAVWDPVLNTVIFDRNGADGGQNMPVKQMYTGERDYLFSNTYEKTNYIFLGWDRNATAKIPEYSNGYFYTMGAKSVTLYAIWEIEVLKITFYSNGSTDGINSVVQNFDSGETKNLSPNTFVRDGYTFAGWGTTAVSTEIAYPDGGEFTMTGSVRNPVMYAVWTPNLNKILFNGNGNTNDVSMIDQEVKTGAYAYLRPNLFVKINYVFMGWAKTPAATAAEFADKEYYLMGQNATYTLYAVWSQIQNRITFNANGGTGTMSEQIIGQGSKAALNANAFSRIGYDFTGWAISPGGSKAYDDAAQYAMGTSASTVLYAKWKIQTYTVSFDGAGGKTGDGKSVVSVSADYGTVIKPPEFIRPGFKVDGYVDQNGNPADLSSASGSANLKPKWAFDEGVITITVKNPDSSAGNGYQSLKVTDLVPIDNVVYLFQWYALESGSWKAMQGETSDTLIVGADKDPANYRAMVTVVFTDGSGADGDYNIENYVDSKGKPISGGGSSGVSILRPGFSGNQSIIIAVAVVLGVIILIVIIALVAGAVSKERKRREAEEQNAYWQ